MVVRHLGRGGITTGVAGRAAESVRSVLQLRQPAQRARAGAKHRRDAEARAPRLRSRDRDRRSAGDCRRLVARAGSDGRAAGALRPKSAGGGADSAHHPLVRDRRDAEGDVHLHRLRAVRVLGYRARDRQRAGSLCRDRADARRVTLSDRDEGARRARAAGHLQQPAAPVRDGVRIHHAGRADQRQLRARLSADDQPAARPVGAHHPDPHGHRAAGLRHRPDAVLFPARSVSLPRGHE